MVADSTRRQQGTPAFALSRWIAAIMYSYTVAIVTLISLGAGLLLGMLLRARLPQTHFEPESKDILKTAAGLMATLVALVIGLLVSSAKSSFDTTTSGITQFGARAISLDRTLARYGPEAKAARDQLRHSIEANRDRLWPTARTARPDVAAAARDNHLEGVQDSILALTPKDDAHKLRQQQALSICGDLLQARWLLVEEAQTSLPPIFLVVLVFWLTVLYASFGLLAPRNPTAIIALLVCALSMSAALFLILEMNHPFDGAIQVSSLPIDRALEFVNR
jgi:hypothetical protein